MYALSYYSITYYDGFELVFDCSRLHQSCTHPNTWMFECTMQFITVWSLQWLHFVGLQQSILTCPVATAHSQAVSSPGGHSAAGKISIMC